MNRKALFSLFLAGFTSMIGLGVTASFMTAYSENLGANGLWIGMIFSGFVVARSI